MPKNKLQIYWIRHGETDWNARRIIQGRKINAPLNENGKRQALFFAQYYQNVHFHHMYTSPLLRCIQTVMPLVEQKNLPFTILPELIEFDWGLAEGEENEELRNLYYYGSIQRWEKGDYHEPCPGGESPLSALNRILKAWYFILERHQTGNQTLLICTHSRISRIFFCHLFQLPLSEMQRFPIHNVGLYLFSIDPENGLQCLKQNDITHLQTCVLP